MVSLEKNNMAFGIIISGIIIFLCYLLVILIYTLTSVIILFVVEGDVFVIPGTILGCYVSFRYRKEEQTFMKLGIIVGIGGAFLSTVFIAFYYFLFYPNIIYFLLIILSLIIFYLLFGFITGYIMAMIYLRKEEKSKSISSDIRGLDLLEK